MRRKLVIITVALIAAVFCFDYLKIDLRPSGSDKLIASDRVYGRIVSIKEKDEYTSLVIKDKITNVRCTLIVDKIQNINEYAGAFVETEAELNIPNTRRNPHCFNYRKYLYSENIFATGIVKGDIRIVKSDAISKVLKWIYRTKFEFCNALSEKSKGIVMGVLFGDTDYLDDSYLDSFRNAGTAHILTVSGLHVNLIYGLFSKLTGKKQSSIKVLLIMILLIIYGTFSSWRPSIIRAEGMIALKIFAESKEYRYDSLTALSFMALCLIINNPYIVFSQGFQMSFLAILSINVFSRVIPLSIPESIRSSLSVTITLSVYQGFIFNRISFVSIIANIPVIYLAGILIPFAFLVFSIFIIFSSITILNLPLDILVYTLEKTNSIVSFDGKGSIDIISLQSGIIIFILMIIFFESSEYKLINTIRGCRKNLQIVRTLILAVSVCTFIIYYDPVSACNIVFVDVGQGDCIHIRDHRTNMLIDGGGSFNKNIGEDILKPYLLKNGVGSLDFILATHEDMDHYKGLSELKDCFNTPDIFKGAVIGDRFNISKNISVTTLWPVEIDNDGQNENSECSVFLINYGGLKILTTGDLDCEGEYKIIEYYKNNKMLYMLKADILKVGHHGSYTSTSQQFIDIVNPEYAIIQVGKNNYGHPSQKTIDLLEKNNITVYRNDTMGAIGIKLIIKKGNVVKSKIYTEIN